MGRLFLCSGGVSLHVALVYAHTVKLENINCVFPQKMDVTVISLLPTQPFSQKIISQTHGKRWEKDSVRQL